MDFHFVQALKRTRVVIDEYRGSDEVWDELAQVVEDLHDRMTLEEHDGARLERAEEGATEQRAVAALMALDDRPTDEHARTALDALRDLAHEIV